MKKKWKHIKVIICLMFLMTMTVSMQVSAANIKLSKKAALYVGKSKDFSSAVKGVKGKVKWSSSNKKVAAVTKKGKVTAKKAGKVKITVKVGKKSATCQLTVKKKGQSNTVKSDAANAKKAYMKELKNYNDAMYTKKYCMKDIDQNGVDELIIQYQDGMNCRLLIFTYKDGKLGKLMDTTGMGELYYNSSNKQIVITFSSGAADADIIYYKMDDLQLKKVRHYRSVSVYEENFTVNYYKGKTSITEEEFYRQFGLVRKLQNIAPYSVGIEF